MLRCYGAAEKSPLDREIEMERLYYTSIFIKRCNTVTFSHGRLDRGRKNRVTVPVTPVTPSVTLPHHTPATPTPDTLPTVARPGRPAGSGAPAPAMAPNA